jgi:hypothetical protein
MSIRKSIIGLCAVAALALPATAMAAPPSYNINGFSPDPTTVGQPGCFGQWRSEAVQSINAGNLPGFDNAGQYLSSQNSDNAANNIRDKTTCGL